MSVDSQALNPSSQEVPLSFPALHAYPKKRLALGMTSVGLIVCLAAWVWLTGYNGKFLSDLQERGWPEISALLVVVLLHGVLMFPLDWLGGARLPRQYQLDYRITRMNYVKAVIWHGGIWFATISLIHQAGALAGLPGALLALLSIMALGIAFQGTLALRIGSFRMGFQEPTQGIIPTHALHSEDPAFSGGITGLPGKERLVIPAKWQTTLGTDAWKICMERRNQIHHQGLRNQGLIGAILWNLIGFVLAATLAGFPQQGMRSTLDLVCLSTLWHFLGLLMLPSWSQRATHHLDYVMQSQSHRETLFGDWLMKVNDLVEGEKARKPWVEKIFHPTPSVVNRIKQARRYRWAPWHIARMMLYLSWLNGGLLSRSVHCNIGRPNLWVMTPTDG